MKVLVTGGAGFIGSHLMRYLRQRGDEAIALDNLSVGRRENLEEGMELIEMDVRDERLAGVIATGQYDAVVHLAGQTLVSQSLEEPAFDADSNIIGMIRVLEAVRQSGVRRVVFSSTAAVYGDVPERDLPIKEAHVLSPMSFYGLSKVTAERYLELYHECFGLDYVALRFANVYGERQGDGGEGGVISIFARSVAEGNEITIFGDGEQTRDFIYAGDVAEGVAAALTTPQTNVVYNLSTQTQTSLRELVDVLSDVAGRRVIPKYGPERPGDIYKSSLSNTRARRGLGWKPTVSLEEGLRRTYEYFLKKAEVS